jgi:(p)ppGpp synthase/HD superfamily hydrolase
VSVQLGADFAKAVAYAVEAHGDQTRKGTDIPYAAHLLAVCALVLEAGGSEVQAIAALLHDTAEDCGGQPRLDDIRSRFGDAVASIVEDCSDSLAEDPSEKADWRERKLAYLAHLLFAPPDALLVSVADKLHNATSIVRDLNDVRPKMFERFNATAEETFRYYTDLVGAFAQRREDMTPAGQALVGELAAAVNAMRAFIDSR